MLGFDIGDIATDVSKEAFTMGRETHFFLFIRNNSSKPVLFINKDEVDIHDLPGIDAESMGKEVMGFYLRFDHGDGSGDFTLAQDKNKITGSLRDSLGWNIIKRDSGVHAPYWVVCPGKDISLEPGGCVSVFFDGILCSNVHGMANLYVQLKYDRNYFYNCNLKKVYDPGILNFDVREQEYHLGEEITLAWELKEAEESEVTLNGALISRGVLEKRVIAKSDDKYTLCVTNPAHEGDSKAYEIKVPCIKSFSLLSVSQEKARFSWEAFQSDTKRVYLKEQPGTEMALSGEKEFAIETKADRSFNLVACQKDSSVEVSWEIGYKIPKIYSAEAHRVYRSGRLQPMREASEAFVPPELLYTGEGLEASIVTFKGPPPPPPPQPTRDAGFRWQMENVQKVEVLVNGSLCGTYSPYDNPEITVGWEDEAVVAGIDAYGYRIEVRVKIQ